MKKVNRVVSGKELASLELDDPNPGRQAWWRRLRTVMLMRKDSALLFLPCMPTQLGGFETSKDGINFVAMRASTLRRTGLKFRSDDKFAIFVHEMSHYWHFHWNNGRLTAGTLDKGRRVPSIETPEGKEYYAAPSGRFLVELEAWHLSRNSNDQFHMDLDEAIDKVNKINMSNVCMMTGLVKGHGRKFQDRIMDLNPFDNWRLDKDGHLTDCFLGLD